MRAAYLTELGPAENIRVGEVAAPVPREGEVLVRVDAAAVNHVDTFVRSGAYPTKMTLPFVVGRDLVGTVVQSEPGFIAGQSVWCNSLGYDGRQGACAEFATVPAGRLYPLPAGVDPFTALAAFHPAATAWLGLRRDARIAEGDTVVVYGSGGAVGSAVVQLAVAWGAHVIAVDRAVNAEWALECGASAVVDRDACDAIDQVSALAYRAVDLLWDTTGLLDMRRLLPLMGLGGQVVVVAGLTATAMLPIGAMYTRDISVRGFAISNATEADLRAAARDINVLLSEGRLRARSVVQFELGDIAAAHRAQEARLFPCSRLVVRLQ
jgi:NADPH:quinone reductase-like Zn-dependent oxidoreductase